MLDALLQLVFDKVPTWLTGAVLFLLLSFLLAWVRKRRWARNPEALKAAIDKETDPARREVLMDIYNRLTFEVMLGRQPQPFTKAERVVFLVSVPLLLLLLLALLLWAPLRAGFERREDRDAQSPTVEAIRQTILQFLEAYTKGAVATAERLTTEEHSPEFLLTASTLKDFPTAYSVESIRVTDASGTVVAHVRIPLRALAKEIQGTVTDEEIRLIIVENRKPLNARNLPPDLFGRSGRLAAVLDMLNGWLGVDAPPVPAGSYAVWVRQIPVVNRGGHWLIRKSVY